MSRTESTYEIHYVYKDHQAFLSPDNYIQAPDFSQSFNRYAYCLNNPLKYTDPSGESIVLAVLVGAFWSSAMSLAVNFDNISTDADFVNVTTLGALGGAVGGAAGFVAGGAVAGVLGTEGAIPGFLISASGGFAGGFAGTSVTSWCTGSTFDDGLMAGLKAGAISGLTAGLIGAYNGAIDAICAGGNMWTGSGIEFAREITGVNISWEVDMQEGMEYSNDFLHRFSEANGLDIDAPKNLGASFADGTAPSGYHTKGSFFTDENEIRQIYAISRNTGFGKYNTYYAQAAFSCPEELYLTITHEYLHLHLYGLGYTQKGLEDFHHASISRYELAQARRWDYRVDYYESVYRGYSAKYIGRGNYVDYKNYLFPITNRPIIPVIKP